MQIKITMNYPTRTIEMKLLFIADVCISGYNHFGKLFGGISTKTEHMQIQ